MLLLKFSAKCWLSIIMFFVSNNSIVSYWGIVSYWKHFKKVLIYNPKQDNPIETTHKNSWLTWTSYQTAGFRLHGRTQAFSSTVTTTVRWSRTVTGAVSLHHSSSTRHVTCWPITPFRVPAILCEPRKNTNTFEKNSTGQIRNTSTLTKKKTDKSNVYNTAPM